MKLRTLALGAVVASALVPTLAAAQFNPLFNHLQCYKISRKCPPTVAGCGIAPVGKTVTLTDQFGSAQAAVLTPVLLCVPTHKTCGSVPCGPDPTNHPVDHFKCYKVKSAKRLVQPVVTLTDQFGTETVSVTAPQLLCTPVLKQVILPTTTTTTTLPPCGAGTGTAGSCVGECPDPRQVCDTGEFGCNCVIPCGNSAPTCDGICPPNATCTPDPNGCHCSPVQPCEVSHSPMCGGFCPDGLVCNAPPSGQTGAPCVCMPPEGCHTDTTTAPPTCGGTCPQGMACLSPNLNGPCACIPAQQGCAAGGAAGQCGGACPALQENCVLNPSSNTCSCSPAG